MFGEAKKIIDFFPGAYHCIVTCHAPGNTIGLHEDESNEDEIDYIRVQIPIITNDKAVFMFDDEEYNFKEGSAYLINTHTSHGTRNDGDTYRIHLVLSIPTDAAEYVLNLNADTKSM